MEKLIIYSDGGARGNPGPAGIGIVIEIRNPNDEIRKQTISKFIGTATNNQAEYQAVIEALKWVLNHFALTSEVRVGVEFFLDSQLVVEQLNGNYKLKNEGLKPLFWEIRELIMKLGGRVSFKYIPREKNKEADKLVNKVLDEKSKNTI